MTKKYFDSIDYLVLSRQYDKSNNVIDRALVRDIDVGIYDYVKSKGSSIHKYMDIEKVIFNNPATIIIWADGTKTVVKAENEVFDPEKGLAMAISKKFFGNKGSYFNVFKKWIPELKMRELYDNRFPVTIPDDIIEKLIELYKNSGR